MCRWILQMHVRSVAESLVFKRCLKNLGVGADLSIYTTLASCTKPKILKFVSKKNSDVKGKKDSSSSNDSAKTTNAANDTDFFHICLSL